MNNEIQSIISAALQAVNPKVFIPKVLQREQDQLIIAGKTFEWKQFKHIYLVAIGKAGLSMAAAVDSVLHDAVTEGIILTKHIDDSFQFSEKYRIFKGGHPVPDDGSVQGANAILAMLGKTLADDLVIFLISGGGSALLTCPRPGVSLKDMQDFSAQILACGADINEFNTMRKHLDLVKGGGLALQAAPALCVSIILSDVVGSNLSTIASGPTVPDPSTFDDAIRILDKYQLRGSVPASILKVLQDGQMGLIPETLKNDDPCCKKIINCLAADNRIAAVAAAEKGRQLGFNSVILSTMLTGEAAAVGAMLPAFLSEIDRPGSWIHRPALMIFGGETTVHIHGNGLGGRNQELALAAVRPMSDMKGSALVTLATDGEDGPTDAAGAFVSDETLQKGLAHGLKPEDFLNRNDAYHYFEALNDLLKTGPSGTNVNDLTFLFAF